MSNPTSAQQLTESDSETYDESAKYVKKVQEAFRGKKELYDEYLDIMKAVKARSYKDLSGVITRVKELFKDHRDLMLGINYFLPEGYKITLPPEDEGDENIDREDTDKTNDDIRDRDTDNRGLAKLIDKLDLSKCKICTPSYRLLPENYTVPKTSHRTEIGDSVLNDRLMLVTSGSEDYKHVRKNEYEKALFRCEEDMFEMDMLLETVTATAKCIEELSDSMNSQTNNTETETTLCVEEHLPVMSLRCIERLYGDNGLEVMDILRKNPPRALPIILRRLNQKREEIFKCRADFNEVWAEAYAKNSHRSLDHRSSDFKQQDTKNLSAKVLLAEIKGISKKNENVNEKVPHMDFKYTDLDIHEDLYQLMNDVTGENWLHERHIAVMKIWTRFVETFLGLPSRPESVEEELNDVDDNAEEKGSFDFECIIRGKSDSELKNVEQYPEAPPDGDGVRDETDKAEGEGEAHQKSDAGGLEGTLHGKKQNSQIFYANNTIYLFFRFHQILYERMQSAKLCSENKKRSSNSAITSDPYVRFKEALHSLLVGVIDNAEFEDECLSVLGPQSYVLFTLDNLIHKLLKQLKEISTKEAEQKLLKFYAQARSRKPADFRDSVYHESARHLLPDGNLYRIECFALSSPMRLTIQLMKNDSDSTSYFLGDHLSLNRRRTTPEKRKRTFK